ncbi:MAG: DUF3047 domain-containing protein [Candidatus Omnitrophota bacterium]
MKKKNNKLVILLITLGCLSIFLSWKFYEFKKARLTRDRVLKSTAWFKFNNKNALKGWEEKVFKGRVIYSLIESNKTDGYLNAYSNDAASGLLYWLKFNPKEYPMVSWKWKVVKFPEVKNAASNAVSIENSWLEKDDYAARFYVIFPRFPFFRLRCLEYVWDKNLPLGTVLVNPSFKNLKIIVAESGETNKGNWVTIERNVFEDFKKLFDAEPPSVGAIAIMTDSENSQSIAEAQYNDIEVGYGKQ